MFLRGIGKYLFVFPAEVVKEVKDVEKMAFPYSALVFAPYIVLYVYLSIHLTLKQALLMLCASTLFALLEEEKSPWKTFFLSLVGGAFFTVSLDYFYAYLYGLFGGFLFSREVYVNKEWKVYVKL